MSLVNMFGNKIPAAAGGGYGSEVSLMLHCDGADDGTTFTDSSSYAHTVTPIATVTDTGIKKFGTASAQYGASASLGIPDHSSFDFGTGDWSIDFQLYFSSDTGVKILFDKGASTSWMRAYINTSDTKFYLNINGSTPLSGVIFTQSQDTWGHWEVSRTSGTIYFFVDGVLVDSAANALNADSGDQLDFGKDAFGNFAPGVQIDEIRVQKGTYGHTTGFTPPTSAY